MRTMVDFLVKNWPTVLIPLVVFLISLMVFFWLRKMTLDRLGKWFKKVDLLIGNILLQSFRVPFSILCLILSLYLGLEVSRIPQEWKVPAGNGLWSMFVLATTITLINLAKEAILFYGRKYSLPQRLVSIVCKAIWTTVIVIAFLVVLDLWGVPTSPLLLLIVVIILIAFLVFRDTAPNFFASFQISASQEIKVGDYIKLDSGSEGYITAIKWNKIVLAAPDGSNILVPNAILVHRKVINYGRPLKKAKIPFLFKTCIHSTETTGLKAGSLQELVDILKQAPDEIIHYHTHAFLKEHQYLISPLSNDFALWVGDSLGNRVLARELSNVDKFQLKNPVAFRDKLVEIIEEYVSDNPYSQSVISGREFYFKKSLSTELPVIYKARDLREFTEDLRKISPASLYFHVFESRLRLDLDMDDFSLWLKEAMEEDELSQQIAGINLYNSSLEEIRSALIQIIEKRIK